MKTNFLVQRNPIITISIILFVLSFVVQAGEWLPLEKDGLHDPDSTAVKVLQQPAAALSILPPDTAGNQVRWVQALREGYINPRSHLHDNAELEILDTEILLKNTGDQPFVLFPHKAHTEWLDCSNCHEHLFKSRIGASGMSMFAILQGEFCGRCHGAVSFPLTECNRCHSVAQIPSQEKN